jgi:geranylgeranyl diphosphate synthase type 3
MKRQVSLGSQLIHVNLTWFAQSLLEPFTYIASMPGKGVRSHMIQAFNLWLDVPKEKMKAISRIVNMLHNASLM